MRLLLVVALVFSTFASAEVTYEVGEAHEPFPAVARNRGKVDGKVTFLVFKQPGARRPIKHCALVHGYGVTQSRLNGGKKLREWTGLQAGLTFAKIYYGQAVIDEMLAKSCESVYVPIQESNHTTIFEMTQRTEMFLRDEVCNLSSVPNGQIGCALVGHSKGGAVAFNVARRCMNETSLLGEKGCRQLGKIYSAAGVIQGASAPALILGAKILGHRNDTRARTVFTAFDSWADTFSRLLLNTGDVVWDMKSDKSDFTNPTWFDLSPLAPQEDGEPLYLVNDVVLEKKNWLVADFAASITKYEFNGSVMDHVGCGARAPVPTGTSEAIHYRAHETFCGVFGAAMGTIHSGLLQSAFEEGAHAFSRMARDAADARFVDESLTWERFQSGDGFADYELSLGTCLRSVGLPGSAVTSCKRLTNINHQAAAGGAAEVRRDIVKHLGRGLTRIW